MNNKIQQLIYIDNIIKNKDPIPIIASSKIAIIIHVYYIDIWADLVFYLKKINTPYDLYVTLPEDTSDDFIIQMMKIFPQVAVYVVENKGRDVLPFLQVIDVIGVDTYSYICKIHTKKTGESALGNAWRKLLYFDLIGSQQTVDSIVSTFEEDTTVGMITGSNTILNSQKYAYGNNSNIETLAQKASIVYDEHYLFAAGTMFWVRSEILKPIVSLYQTQELDFEEEKGQAENTLAHAIERFFGILVQVTKQHLAPSPTKYTNLDESTLQELSSLVLSQQYRGVDAFFSQKKTILDLEASLRFKETEIETLIQIAESMRIKNRIKNIVPDKIIPLAKKVAKIPAKTLSVLKVVKNNPSLLKKVFYYASRGELKYLVTKIKEKSAKNLAQSSVLTEVLTANYFKPFDTKTYALDDITIDIIIPVYNGYEFLEALFDSIEKNTSSPYRLIVINDCSPDEQVKPYLLQRLEKHSSAIFLDHEENQGFLKSVNEAYTHTSNHFVLLNTDTEVPSFWLERLMYPILHMDKVASTTPFTNSGEIASFPNFVADNDIFDGMSVDTLDEVFKEVNPEKFYAEVPTGVGFCMGVNYTLTKDIGMFVEDTFGKGYGEENDWCQRAIKHGYTNLIVPNLFVYHKHGGSFTAEEKKKLLEKNAITLLERHPNYSKDVTTYIQENPHETLRKLLVLMASDKQVGTHLIFDHALGGGANIYTNELIEAYVKEKKNVLLVQYDFYSHHFILSHRYKTYNFKFKISDFTELQTFINKLHVKEVFINNFVSYKNPFEILDYIHTLNSKSETNLIIPIHDFYTLSPSYNLLNEEGKYNLQDCLNDTKMSANMQEWRTFYSDEVDMPRWHTSWTKLLEGSHKVLCFSNSSKDIVLEAYPSIEEKITVVPHTVEGIHPLVWKKDPNKTTVTVGVLGGINYVKGSHIIKQMIQLIEGDGLDVDVVVIGDITESIRSKHFTTTGRYELDKLPQIIQEHDIDVFLIPSIWPETFSYTTQEIMMMELPLMVFDLGAPAERVREYDKGYIIPEISAEATLASITQFKISNT